MGFIARDLRASAVNGIHEESASRHVSYCTPRLYRFTELAMVVYVLPRQMLKDIRQAIRLLAKNPGFTAIAALSLAIGIGANSAVFSFADALLLRPLPVDDPNGVVTVS